MPKINQVRGGVCSELGERARVGHTTAGTVRRQKETSAPVFHLSLIETPIGQSPTTNLSAH